MTVERFEPRRRVRESRESAVPAAKPAVYRTYVHKPGRKARLYRIDPIGSSWRCEVHIGAEIHRTAIVPTRTHMVEQRRGFEREVADLLADGWTLDG